MQAAPQADTPEGNQQLQAQKAALGAMAVSLVDVRCRAQYLAVEPSLETLLHAAAVLPGYPDEFQAERRIVAAKAVAASVQRDAFVRDCLIQNVCLLLISTLRTQFLHSSVNHKNSLPKACLCSSARSNVREGTDSLLL